MQNDFLSSAIRHGILPIKQSKNPASSKLVTAARIEMFNYGYILPNDDLLSVASVGYLQKILKAARTVAGADRDMVPTYPGFPKQVQELDTLTLLWEQILHYWTGGAYMPNHPTEVRPGLSIEDAAKGSRELKVIPFDEAIRESISSIVLSPVSMSADDRNLVMTAMQESTMELDEVVALFAQCKNFENSQVLVEGYAQSTDNKEAFTQFVKNSKDVDQLLRVVLSLSSIAVTGQDDKALDALHNLNNGSAWARQMVTLSRPDRRALVTRLGTLTKGYRADKMLSHQELWQRVMRMVHPYSIALDNDARRAVDILHQNIEHTTLNALVEKYLAEGKVHALVSLLEENKRTGELVRRAVAILRKVKDQTEAAVLADSIAMNGYNVPLTTLISAYNGVIDANSDYEKITRVAGKNNTMRTAGAKIDKKFQKLVLDALETAIRVKLSNGPLATAPVNVVSKDPVPLVRRDLGVSDRVMDRGMHFPVMGEGDTIRLFCHWVNNQRQGGFVDIAAVLLDKDFKSLATVTWNTWSQCRKWSAYSGDEYVYPGCSAAEYVDVDTIKVKESHPEARYVVLTLQSWSGLPLDKMSVMCGSMLRKEPNSGEVFEPQTVEAAFQPTTTAMQSVPLVFDMETGEMIWIDSSSGSTKTGVSAVDDAAVGPVVRDEISRPRMTMGQLAAMWAEMSEVETVQEPVDRDMIVKLLG